MTKPMNRVAPNKRQITRGKRSPREAEKGRRMLDGEPNGMKERQVSKLKELADALVAAGFVSLDEQANELGLSRSTTWTILNAKHKNYGLSAALIRRILHKPGLNSRVRAKIIEYVRERAAGSYGHNKAQLRRFAEHLAAHSATAVHDKLFAYLNTRRTALEPRSGRNGTGKIDGL